MIARCWGRCPGGAAAFLGVTRTAHHAKALLGSRCDGYYYYMNIYNYNFNYNDSYYDDC